MTSQKLRTSKKIWGKLRLYFMDGPYCPFSMLPRLLQINKYTCALYRLEFYYVREMVKEW